MEALEGSLHSHRSSLSRAVTDDELSPNLVHRPKVGRHQCVRKMPAAWIGMVETVFVQDAQQPRGSSRPPNVATGGARPLEEQGQGRDRDLTAHTFPSKQHKPGSFAILPMPSSRATDPWLRRWSGAAQIRMPCLCLGENAPENRRLQETDMFLTYGNSCCFAIAFAPEWGASAYAGRGEAC